MYEIYQSNQQQKLPRLNKQCAEQAADKAHHGQIKKGTYMQLQLDK